MKKLIVLVTLSTLLFSRTIILDEEPVETVEGKIFYVLTMCKDGYQYTGYHKGDLLDFKIVQDFEQTAKLTSPIECPMDFKHKSQLDK
jgi:hypothetical protein